METFGLMWFHDQESAGSAIAIIMVDQAVVFVHILIETEQHGYGFYLHSEDCRHLVDLLKQGMSADQSPVIAGPEHAEDLIAPTSDQVEQAKMVSSPTREIGHFIFKDAYYGQEGHAILRKTRDNLLLFLSVHRHTDVEFALDVPQCPRLVEILEGAIVVSEMLKRTGRTRIKG